MEAIGFIIIIAIILAIYNAGYDAGKREGSRKGYGVGFSRGRRQSGGCLFVFIVCAFIIFTMAKSLAHFIAN